MCIPGFTVTGTERKITLFLLATNECNMKGILSPGFAEDGQARSGSCLPLLIRNPL